MYQFFYKLCKQKYFLNNIDINQIRIKLNLYCLVFRFKLDIRIRYDIIIFLFRKLGVEDFSKRKIINFLFQLNLKIFCYVFKEEVFFFLVIEMKERDKI